VASFTYLNGTAMCGPVLHCSVDFRGYKRIAPTEPVPLKYVKLAANIRGYADIFTVCIPTPRLHREIERVTCERLSDGELAVVASLVGVTISLKL